jgi:hypothetical protein
MEKLNQFLAKWLDKGTTGVVSVVDGVGGVTHTTLAHSLDSLFRVFGATGVQVAALLGVVGSAITRVKLALERAAGEGLPPF